MPSAPTRDGARVGVDVGGTFTDVVGLVDGRVVAAKVPSTPDDQSVGVLRGLDGAGLDAASVAILAHGTTVATNALLERRGARTGLLTTDGFRDVIEIGRQNRPALYDLTKRAPEPLVPRQWRFTVRERIGPEGVLVPLDQASLEEAIAGLRAAEVEAVAVCFLFSFLDSRHEQEAAAAVRSALPHARVSLSSEVMPEFREYERFSTTTADAYLAPRLSNYLRRLGTRLADRGLPEPVVMQSSGGVLPLEVVTQRSSACVLSGPAAGVVGAAFAAGRCGFSDLLTFDMGGTSTDVALVLGGDVEMTTASVIGGVPIKHPMVDVHTVSAGGGSIVWVDDGGALRIGPESAGASPGPAGYGLGGQDATVTDADLLLGHLPDGALLGGRLLLRRELAEHALACVGERVGMEAVDIAAGVVTVAEAEMVRAMRIVTVERGIDPRALTLVAFGGAGGMHACALAEELGIAAVLIPEAAGVLSALGLAISDLRRDYASAFFAQLPRLDYVAVESAFAALEQQAERDLAGAELRRLADLRYCGQAFELTVQADNLEEIEHRFKDAHRLRYGFDLAEEMIEIVNLRLTAVSPGFKPRLQTLPAGEPEMEPGRRLVYFDGAWIETPVWRSEQLTPGRSSRGPLIVELAESTCVVRPSWWARIAGSGGLVLERV